MLTPVRGALVAMVLAAATALLPASAASANACATDRTTEYITPVTFHVEVGKFKKSYSRGQRVKVAVEVTRPAHQDPAGLGVTFDSPTAQPAAEVNVGVGLSVGRVFLPGYGRTNEQGKTTVSIRIERYVKPGSADVRAFAYRETVSTTCATVEEQGYRNLPNAFRVTG
ncbi:MAG: hypothetical protein M3198_14635 [Actinomycetota bacterium]|nr:hypothetical protein [Actinomycetota bacterium]